MPASAGDDGGAESRGSHVDLGPKPDLGGEAVAINVKDHPLPLTEHAKQRPNEGTVGQFVLNQIGVADHGAGGTTRVERLDDALHGQRPEVGADEAPDTFLTTLLALMHEVHTFNRLGAPLTRARTRWILGFHRRLVRRCEWLTDIPNDGLFPQSSQTAAMADNLSSSALGARYPSWCTTPPHKASGVTNNAKR